MGRILIFKDGMKPPLHYNLWQNRGNARKQQQRKQSLHGMNKNSPQEKGKKGIKEPHNSAS